MVPSLNSGSTTAKCDYTAVKCTISSNKKSQPSSDLSRPVLSPNLSVGASRTVEHREPEIVQRRVFRVADVPARLDRPGTAAHHENRQIIVVVAVAVAVQPPYTIIE